MASGLSDANLGSIKHNEQDNTWNLELFQRFPLENISDSSYWYLTPRYALRNLLRMKLYSETSWLISRNSRFNQFVKKVVFAFSDLKTFFLSWEKSLGIKSYDTPGETKTIKIKI